jgi:hypothetical protein
MTDESAPVRSLRERLGTNAEERLGKALSELLESPLFTGAIGRAFDAREKAAQAQVIALGALNLPSAADIERLTRRVRSVSQRLEAIEEGVERLDSSRLADQRAPAEVDARLTAIELQLGDLLVRLDRLLDVGREPSRASAAGAPKPVASRATAKKRARAGKAPAAARSQRGIEPAPGG